jgi:hypothetical protein
MAAPGITLTLGSYSVEIKDFAGERYPRRTIEWAQISQSARGASVRRSPSYRPKHIWDFQCRLDIDDWETLKRMMALYWDSPAAWTLEDYTMPFAETSPRTRALATGASADDDSTTVLYYAQFNAEPTLYPEFDRLNKTGDLLQLQFTETGATTA